MKNFNLLILSSLITLLTAPVAYAVLSESSKPDIKNILISQVVNSEEIKQKAEAITVKIESNNTAGSGVIIGKEGNTYTVITNAHVINSKFPNKIITIDGKNHASKIIKEGNSLEGNDLAVLTFTSSDNYQVATLAINPEVNENKRIYAVGFPEETNEFYFTQGTIKLQAPKPFLGGYQIGYDIDVKPGMSGGALLNEKGELIGVNGLLKGPILNEAYNYLDGSQPFQENIATYRKLSFAVPIQTLVEVAPNLALIPNQWKTGLNLAANVDNIARQITIRIDHKDKVMGSGVIVGKKGDTYYVFTACHVISDAYCKSGKINKNYTLVAPDGDRYSLDYNQIILPQGLDAALIKFNSKKAYQVAKIGRYEIPRKEKQLVFVSGFPGELNGVRKFTVGYRFQRARGLSLAFNTDSQSMKANVDTSGYELWYTNLSKPGMSGGPILDIKGQVIGINTGQEGEQISSTEVRQLGYAFGVPASTLIGFAHQKQVNLNDFTIVDKMPEALKEQELKTIQQHPAFIVKKPPENSSQNTWLNYGNELWRIERYQEAIAAFKKAINIDPNFAEAYYALGLVYSEQATQTNNDTLEIEAIAAFEQGISLSRNWILTGQIWYRKSISLSNLEKHQEALLAINQGIKLIDDDAKFYRQRGLILVDLNHHAEAKEAFTQSLEIAALGLTYFDRCGLLIFDIHDLEAAREDCSKAIELGLIEGYSMRAIAQAALGNEQASLADHNQAIALAPNSFYSYMVRAFTYDLMGNNEQAIADSTKAIELSPNDADLYSFRAGQYLQMRNYGKAIADSTKAIELDPSNPSQYSQRGMYYRLNGQYDLAVKDYTKAIEIKPDNAEYYRQRGSYKSLLGDSQGALDDYNQAIKLNPNDAIAYQGRGDLYVVNLPDYEQAMTDYSRAIAINPQYGMAYQARGYLRKYLSDLPGALEDYNQAIALLEAPNPAIRFTWVGIPSQDLLPESFFSQQASSHPYSRVYQFRGTVRMQLKDYQGALEDYNEAIRLDPKDGDYYLSRGDYYSQTNQPEKAKADYHQAIENYSVTINNDPNNAKNYGFYMNRAKLYQKLNNHQAAIADLSKAIELAPFNKHLFYLLRGNYYRKMQKHESAIKDYSKAIEIEPQSINAYIFRGGIYHSLGNYQEGIKDFSKVIALNEEINNRQNHVAYLVRGGLYQQLNNYPEAIKDFSNFIKLQPENHQGYLSRCLVYTALKDYNQAMNDCNQAIKIAPDKPEVYRGSAHLNRRLNNYSVALKDANKIIEIGPDLPMGYWVRGLIYWAQNNPTKALSDYELALSKNDQFAPAISSIGFIKYEQGEKKKAVELWQKAINLKDDLSDTKLALAVGLYHQGKPEKALSLAKEALNMDQRLENINHLQDSLWGEQLIKDTKPLLNKITNP